MDEMEENTIKPEEGLIKFIFSIAIVLLFFNCLHIFPRKKESESEISIQKQILLTI